MSLMSSSEREEHLSGIDVFFMAKIMQEEGFQVEPFHHHDIWTQHAFLECLLHVLERYPYLKIRPSKHEDYAFILTVSLPYRLKSMYRDVKKRIDKIFYDSECHDGEITAKWHYNEIHVEIMGTVYFHDLLKDFLKELKKIHEVEVSA